MPSAMASAAAFGRLVLQVPHRGLPVLVGCGKRPATASGRRPSARTPA
jgi:hypothetical protein